LRRFLFRLTSCQHRTHTHTFLLLLFLLPLLTSPTLLPTVSPRRPTRAK
jgi:membrane-bound metal-dependent hydrolase YbcI (DUF457 family)